MIFIAATDLKIFMSLSNAVVEYKRHMLDRTLTCELVRVE